MKLPLTLAIMLLTGSLAAQNMTENQPQPVHAGNEIWLPFVAATIVIIWFIPLLFLMAISKFEKLAKKLFIYGIAAIIVIGGIYAALKYLNIL